MYTYFFFLRAIETIEMETGTRRTKDTSDEINLVTPPESCRQVADIDSAKLAKSRKRLLGSGTSNAASTDSQLMKEGLFTEKMPASATKKTKRSKKIDL